jgi:hypothetical protein
MDMTYFFRRYTRVQTLFRDWRIGFVTDSPLHLTIRELQRTFFSPRFWAAIVGVAVLLGLVGPFSTFDSLALAPRFAYWLVIAVSTYLTGVATVDFCAYWLLARWSLPAPLIYTICGAAGGVPITLVVILINQLVYGQHGIALGHLELLFYCMAISATVSGLVAMFTAPYETAETDGEGVDGQSSATVNQRPRILQRLPHGLRGELSHMTMRDHYVDIRTDRGGTLVLMRLADAIAETSGVDGLQIHRSHWVAKNAVQGAVRKEGRLFLRMRDGTLLPISRSCLLAVRRAGLT